MKPKFNQRRRLQHVPRRATRHYKNLCRLLTDNIRDVIWTTDLNLKLTYVSPSVWLQRGFTVEEAMAQGLEEILTPASLELVRRVLREKSTRGSARGVNRFATLELEMMCEDGSTIWTEVRASLLLDRNHRPTGIVGVTRDISERKRAEEERQAITRRNEALVEALGQVVYDWRPLTNELIWGGDFTGILGYSPQEIGTTTESRTSRIYPDDLHKALAEVEQATKERRNYDLEYRFLHRDGTYRWMQDRGVLFMNPEGQLERIIGVFIDINERKQAEEESDLEHRFQLLFEYAPDACYLNDLTGNFVDGNHAAEDLIGYRKGELIGKSFLQVGILPLDQVGKAAALLVRNAAGFSTGPDEFTLIHKDGSQISVEILTAPLTVRGETLVLGIARDITERKKMQLELLRLNKQLAQHVLARTAALHASEDRLRAIFEAEPECVMLVAADGTLLEMNPAGLAMVEADSAADVIGTCTYDLIAPEYREAFRTFHEGVCQGSPAVLEFEIIGRKGTRRWVETHAAPVPFGGSFCQLAVTRDITERKQAEGKLKEQAAHLNALIENSPIGIVVLDAEHRVQMCNPAFERLFLYSESEILGFELDNLIAPPELISEALEFTQRVAAGETVHATTRRRRKNGTLVDVDIHGVPLLIHGRLAGLYGLYEDITERKEAEKSLRQLSGRLVRVQDEERRRIARELHDSTGQSLAALTMNLTTVQRYASELHPEAGKLLSESLALAEQAAREIRVLSYLLHPPLLDEMGLEDAVRHYVGGFANRSGIRVELEFCGARGRLPRDVELTLFRIVQESLTNIHRHSGSPTARISLSVGESEILLEVCDEGRGIPPEMVQRVLNHGIGLGVGIAGMHERVVQLGGRFGILQANPGTLVKVVLPITETCE